MVFGCLVDWFFWEGLGFFFVSSVVVPHTDGIGTPQDSRPRSSHGLMWNHPWEQADVRFTLPSVRHLLNYCPGTVSNHPAPSPQVLLAAHECHNNPCCAQPMHQQITRAVALENMGCSQENNQGNLLLYGLSKREGPKLCSRAWLGGLLLGRREAWPLIKQRKESNGSS